MKLLDIKLAHYSNGPLQYTFMLLTSKKAFDSLDGVAFHESLWNSRELHLSNQNHIQWEDLENAGHREYDKQV